MVPVLGDLPAKEQANGEEREDKEIKKTGTATSDSYSSPSELSETVQPKSSPSKGQKRVHLEKLKTNKVKRVKRSNVQPRTNHTATSTGTKTKSSKVQNTKEVRDEVDVLLLKSPRNMDKCSTPLPPTKSKSNRSNKETVNHTEHHSSRKGSENAKASDGLNTLGNTGSDKSWWKEGNV